MRQGYLAVVAYASVIVHTSLVNVPGSRFSMGSASLVESDVPNPPHVVTASPFRIGVHPVTNAEYKEYVEATGAPAPTSWISSGLAGRSLPVVT